MNRRAAEHFPWQSFVEEEMVARGWGVIDLSQRTSLSIADVEGILREGMWAPRYPDALAKAFGGNAETWRTLFFADLQWELERVSAQ